MMRFRNSVYYFMLRNIHTTAGQYSVYKHLLWYNAGSKQMSAFEKRVSCSRSSTRTFHSPPR